MNIIVLMPVRNEDWILDYTLSTVEAFADHIIIADQQSTDTTRAICAAHSKVKLINNDDVGHSNKVRWLLLDEARKIQGDNLIFCIDADEMISPKTAERIKTEATNEGPGTIFSLPWIQLWKTTSEYRVDGVWNESKKQAAFYDDRIMDYSREFVINDHTARTPSSQSGQSKIIELNDCPLLHFQFVAWNRTEIKQAWYRCSELINSPLNAKRINRKYSASLDTSPAGMQKLVTSPTPPDWFSGIHSPTQETFEKPDYVRLSEIKKWFDEKGILFFEPLQIWHIKELHEVFIQTVGREPVSKTYSSFIQKIADFRNKFRT